LIAVALKVGYVLIMLWLYVSKPVVLAAVIGATVLTAGILSAASRDKN
jgi:hypothetical protein